LLTREDNELLARVGPGTVMGNLFREYWHPFLLPNELEADGPPLRIRLLGEDLIAFRDTSGRVGLIGDNCSHRGASMFFGRNEEDGLRCVYHGWKYDVNGRCVDMPNEPPESNFKDRIVHRAYPCVEHGGVVWTYMGHRTPPPLPQIEWTMLPAEQRYAAKRVQHCNWAQALEGEIDQSHVSFLHSSLASHRPLTPEQEAEADARNPIGRYSRIDKHPVFQVVETPGGILINARRNADDLGMYYHRLTNYLLPNHTMPPSGVQADNPTRVYRGWVPIDDENVLVVAVDFNPGRPLTEQERAGREAGGGAGYVGRDHFAPATTAPFGAWEPKATLANDFLLDRELQKSRTFSGIPEFWAQDAGVQMSMGLICNRSTEHLGTSDLGIMRFRQRVIEAAKKLRDEGQLPPGIEDASVYATRSAMAFLPKDVDWYEAMAEQRRVVPGTNPGGSAAGVPQPTVAGGRRGNAGD
jgi:phenylpropionate dioxygenase-like ring-hydroxylating dioxygenase large terminal subunit